MERRTLLGNVIGTVGIAAVSGCLSGSTGGEEETGEQETLEPATTTAATTEQSEDEDQTENADETATAEQTEATATATEEPATIEFDAEIEQITKCGETCRELTYALINRGDKKAPDVTVNIKVFTDGEKLWEYDMDVGDLGGRSKLTGISKEIDVGLSGGRKIKSNDGDVVIKLTPQADGVSETFSFERTLDV